MRCSDGFCGADDCDRCYPGCCDMVECVNDCGSVAPAWMYGQTCKDCGGDVCDNCEMVSGRCNSCNADFLADKEDG